MTGGRKSGVTTHVKRRQLGQFSTQPFKFYISDLKPAWRL